MPAARPQQLRCVDLDHRDTAGHTIREVLQNRVGNPVGFANEIEEFGDILERSQLDQGSLKEMEESQDIRRRKTITSGTWPLPVIVSCLAVLVGIIHAFAFPSF